MAKKNILLVNDAAFSAEEMLHGFENLTAHDVNFLSAQDHPNATTEEFQEKMLRMEVEGPEAITPPAEVLEIIKDAEILVIHYTVVTKKVIRAAQKLKLIGVLRGGIDNVNMQAVKSRNIQVVNAPGRSAEAVSDFTIGLMIAESKNIVRGSLALRKGTWTRNYVNSAYSHNLKNRTLGMIGFGTIGAMLARKLSGFGINILVYDPFVEVEKVAQAGCRIVALDKLLAEADFVTLHARLTAENEGLIGKDELAQMKPTAFLINTARAGLIDEPALIDALINKQIGGAALDVFSTEPLPAEHPLMEQENVTITPHLAGVSCDTLNDSLEIMSQELERYLRNQPLRYTCK